MYSLHSCEIDGAKSMGTGKERMKFDWTKYRTDEEGLKLVEYSHRIGPAIRAKYNLQRVERLDAGIKEGEKVLFEKTDEMKPPCKEYAAPDLENVDHSSESPSLPEQSGGLSRSNIHQAVDPASDAYIEELGRKAKAYFKRIHKKRFDEEELVKNGFQYMKEETFLAFRNYVTEHDLFEDSDYQFGEVLHHCFTAEGYGKVYTHYNFTVDVKKNGENDWTSRRYFAEAKLEHGVKFYFCAPLEGVNDGSCYSCTTKELQHPSEGGYEKGRQASGSGHPSTVRFQ